MCNKAPKEKEEDDWMDVFNYIARKRTKRECKSSTLPSISYYQPTLIQILTLFSKYPAAKPDQIMITTPIFLFLSCSLSCNSRSLYVMMFTPVSGVSFT